MNYDAGSSISKYPVEQGSFASFNKVNAPSMATVQMAKGSGGVGLRRGLFLAQLEGLLKSTLSFHIITPEYVYLNYQIVGINHARTAQDGATMITVNLDLEEVLEAKVDYSVEEVKNPSDSKTIDGGAKESKPNKSLILQGIDFGRRLFGS
ncbi:tail tube initiator-like protein [Acinetobacter phage Ab69]|nr:tail tube initiator-like protein [Acinetobacter phage Ab69]